MTGEPTTPTLGPSMWGSVGIITGADAVINAATFQYGGGAVNTQNFTIDSQSVLSFITGGTTFPLAPTWDPTAGTHAYITNNNFFHNFDAAMQIEPNGLLAGDPLTPLASGHPFFRGNVMQGNGIDGLAVVTDRTYLVDPNNNCNYIGPREAIPALSLGYDEPDGRCRLGFDRPDLCASGHGRPRPEHTTSSTNDQAAPVPNPTSLHRPSRPRPSR